ncbi:response regulator transcription factor [Sporosarcina thermotolerans]|uniref:Response regulator transcription factor n=1 Tax=Sporosarcina thermotolerans TaxID=633404 RepID=A0AAW9AET3_9BACL|nr:response regulator transcription factor [Sporosarcina thermotolerans]MDW0118660.1 response regulator transcription factor [Sporosarcina thermotolerans]WHT48682.1 response regulator transcription factor [Sporosarcina thermotolerans]
MIKIMIVDDQPLVREGLSTLLGLRPEIEVVGTAMDGKDALDKAVILLPDIVLMDIRMPGVNGVEGTKLIKDSLPDVKVLILTTFNDSEYIFDALEEGANGYLLKDMPTDTIVQAILTVHHGGVVLPKEFTSQVLTELRVNNHANMTELPARLKELSDREVEVLNLLGEGLNNREIADALFITEGTVKNHVSNVIQKLGLRDRTQAAIYAVRHGITTF